MPITNIFMFSNYHRFCIIRRYYVRGKSESDAKLKDSSDQACIMDMANWNMTGATNIYNNCCSSKLYVYPSFDTGKICHTSDARLICFALMILSFRYNFIQINKIIIQEENLGKLNLNSILVMLIGLIIRSTEIFSYWIRWFPLCC